MAANVKFSSMFEMNRRDKRAAINASRILQEQRSQGTRTIWLLLDMSISNYHDNKKLKSNFHKFGLSFHDVFCVYYLVFFLIGMMIFTFNIFLISFSITGSSNGLNCIQTYLYILYPAN